MSPYCTNCGTEIEESWKVCPYCGKILKEQETQQTRPQQPQISQQQPYQTQPYQKVYHPSSNNYGIAALICGIIGIPLGFFLVGPVLGIVAIIMGGLGISRDDNNAMAVVGIVLGIIDCVLTLVFFFLLFSLFAWFSFW